MSEGNIQKGKRGEAIAAEYLAQNDLYILHRRYRTPYGEIDIIARDEDILCFIEVKMRRSLAAGNPYDSVTVQKQENIKNAAQQYIDKHTLSGIEEIRFDVISILDRAEDNQPQIEWFKNAFYD